MRSCGAMKTLTTSMSIKQYELCMELCFQIVAKAKLGELAMADKASITAEKMFGGVVEGRVSKQLKEICLLDQTYVKAEDGNSQ